jgi:hypothetical protein
MDIKMNQWPTYSSKISMDNLMRMKIGQTLRTFQQLLDKIVNIAALLCLKMAYKPLYIVKVLLGVFHDRPHLHPRHDNTRYWVERENVSIKADKWHDVWMI